MSQRRFPGKQKGFLVAYVIAAISLFAVSVFALSFGKKDSSSKRYIFDTSSKVSSQLRIVHEQVTNCALLYPSADNGTGFHIRYPAGAAVEVKTLDCPGTVRSLWSSIDSAVPAPHQPSAFGPWKYTNDATGVFITLENLGGSEDLKALNIASEKLISSQYDITGNTFKYWIIKD